MKNYDLKYHYLWRKQHGECEVSQRVLRAGMVDIHHLHVANTRCNRKAFPLFVDSVYNLCLVDSNAHMSQPLPKRLPLWRVERIERGLQRHPKHAKAVNMEASKGGDIKC